MAFFYMYIQLSKFTVIFIDLVTVCNVTVCNITVINVTGFTVTALSRGYKPKALDHFAFSEAPLLSD